MAESTKEKGLIVRHAERRAVELPAEFVLSDPHAKQIHFSASSEALAANHIQCTVVDVSTGGVGIETRHFFPRMASGVLRIYQRGKKSDRAAQLLEHPVTVRRVEMISRDPHYGIGLAFIDRTPELEQAILRLADQLHQEVGRA